MNSLLKRISKGFRRIVKAILTAPVRGCDEVAHGTSFGRRLWGFAKVAAFVLVLVAVGGLFGAASGVIPIKASSGHWPITEWFLKASMSRSVSTHSIGIKAPSLDDPRLVLLGAGHYETACRSCHGSPTHHHPRVAAAMTPHPPYLPPRIDNWEPEELFYIVKHGMKFTGMPAWPADHRDDEVWAMTAFLLEYRTLDAEGYRQLVFGEGLPNPEEVAPNEGVTFEALPDSQPARHVIRVNCARCHGHDGLGRGLGAFPKLAGQSREYLTMALQAYADSERASGVMEPIAAALEPTTIEALADYFSQLEAEPDGASPEPIASANKFQPAHKNEALERGQNIAHQGLAKQRVPACQDCHGPAREHGNSAYPILDGQYAPYLVMQLKLFQSGHRGGSEYAHLMEHVAPCLNAQQIEDVATYYESLPLKRTPSP